MNKEFVITEDGSHTIYIPEMDEHYHSTHGAVQESLHVYINNGLLQFANKEINILEVGFGTGLNAFLTAIYCKKYAISAKYFSIEKYPLAEAEYKKLKLTPKVISTNMQPFGTTFFNRPGIMMFKLRPIFNFTKYRLI